MADITMAMPMCFNGEAYTSDNGSVYKGLDLFAKELLLLNFLKF